jgi:hypothetical protein
MASRWPSSRWCWSPQRALTGPPDLVDLITVLDRVAVHTPRG